MASGNHRLSTHRAIRSFVRRAGRLTPAQGKAVARLLPEYGIECGDALIDLNAAFDRQAPRFIEIGFGNGELLLEMAATHPGRDFIGFEVHEPGVGHCLMEIERRSLTNVRVICRDAVEVMSKSIPDAALDGTYLFFPDPWPKKRHHKRRIVQPDFVALLARKIKPGGLFRTATDWAPYAEHIESTVIANESFEAVDIALEDRRQTKFEKRGKRLGHSIWEHAYRRN
jgi:tRNA (guanine-N7-)-methyltransferase